MALTRPRMGHVWVLVAGPSLKGKEDSGTGLRTRLLVGTAVGNWAEVPSMSQHLMAVAENGMTVAKLLYLLSLGFFILRRKYFYLSSGSCKDQV